SSIDSDPAPSIPILSHHGAGAYLTFAGNHRLRPLIDSGLSHFSDDTKRYFFFIFYNPLALDAVLDNLNIQYVLVTPQPSAWILRLHHHSGWGFVNCTENGMLFKRHAGEDYIFTDSDAKQVAKAKQRLLQVQSYRVAFCFSTMIDNPQESLSIISHSNDWNEAFFNYFSSWIDSLPDAEAAKALANSQLNTNPVLHAFLLIRSSPQGYSELLKAVPDGVDPWIWKVLQIKACLKSGHIDLARQLFQETSSRPAVSAVYASLFHQLYEDKLPPKSFDQWQSWDNGGADLMQSVSGQLNQRINSFTPRLGY
ncbi:hypothetical protein OAG63_01800, partial [Methylacidiphilales bacterium]|nr:hypothetical protein [Candidatus Methylacidiphilales bacterium]